MKGDLPKEGPAGKEEKKALHPDGTGQLPFKG